MVDNSYLPWWIGYLIHIKFRIVLIFTSGDMVGYMDILPYPSAHTIFCRANFRALSHFHLVLGGSPGNGEKFVRDQGNWQNIFRDPGNQTVTGQNIFRVTGKLVSCFPVSGDFRPIFPRISGLISPPPPY